MSRRWGAVLFCLWVLAGPGCGDDSSAGNNNLNGADADVLQGCGNGTLEGAEECDNGAQNSDSTPDACRTNCTRAHCGDGVIDASELCDDGVFNADVVPNACRKDCTLPRCGDGVPDDEYNEACDDGNTEDGDGCTAVCTLPHCGDGVKDPAEACDDGNTDSGDGCNAWCTSNESCGNGIVDSAAGEACDDGNTDDADGCQHDCKLPVCGDGIIDDGELCDDGEASNGVPGDPPPHCNATCDSTGICGNGVLDAYMGERCDDGLDNSDAPNADCRPDCLPQRCGDGVVDVNRGEDCEPGQLGDTTCQSLGYYEGTLTCDPSSCRFDPEHSCDRTCGDGVVDDLDGETCDTDPPVGLSCVNTGADRGHLSCNSLCGPNAEACAFMGFRTVRQAASGRYTAVWGSGPSDVYVLNNYMVPLTPGPGFGYVGRIEHYDGTDWSEAYSQSFSSSRALNAIWGRSAGDIYVVGSGGWIGHYDGTDWTFTAEAPSSVKFHSVWGNDQAVYAVGEDGGAGVIYANSGSGWAEVSTGLTLTAPLYGVWGINDNVFVVGQGKYIQYNGSAWVGTDVPVTLYGVWGRRRGDVFAVGIVGRTLHYDGSTWDFTIAPTTEHLNFVWGSSSTDVYAVGDAGTILYFDGNTWTSVWARTTEDLVGIWGSGGHDIWAVTANGTLLHSDGNQRQTLDLGLSGFNLKGVWGAVDRDVWLVGTGGLVMRYGDTGWLDVTGAPAGDHSAIWGSNAHNVHLVGSAGRYWFDGSSWADLGGSASNVFVAHESLACHSGSTTYNDWDGSTWTSTTVDGGTGTHWIDAWTDGDRRYLVGGPFLIGPGGGGDMKVASYNSVLGWSTVTLGEGRLNAVWGVPGGTVFLVGDDGVAYHGGSHGSWAAMPVLMQEDLNAVWGSAANDVYAVGDNGTMQHWDGTAWEQIRTGTNERLVAVWGHPGRQVFAVGSLGTVVRVRHAFGSPLLCPNGATGCSASDIQLNEVYGGTPYDYIEVVNTGCCARDIGGLTLSWRLSEASTQTYTFPTATVLQPGAVVRVIEANLYLPPHELYRGSGIADNPNTRGWVALCDGACDTSGCTNFLDYFEKRQGTTLPAGAPSCASFDPAPLDVAGEPASGRSATRRAFFGGGSSGRQSDWTTAPMSRD